MSAYTITRYVDHHPSEETESRSSSKGTGENGSAEISKGQIETPSPLQSYYRERLTAHLDALRVAMLGISKDETDQQTASIRRIARVVQRSSGRYGFPDVSRVAATVSEAPDSNIRGTCENLIQKLDEAIAESVAEKVGILVAVADQDTEDMLKVSLSTSNREVLVAETAVDVRAVLADQEVSLVILAVHLGDDDGRDLLIDIREDENMDQVPVFMLYEEIDPRVTSECFALGASTVFGKPFDMTALSLAVSTRLRRQALLGAKDRVTGLPNRATAREAYERMVSLCDLDSSPVSVASLKFDHSAPIIEIYGPSTGAAVIRRASQLIVRTLRDADLFARWDSNRYVALFPDTSVQQAVQLLDAALYAVHQTSFEAQSGESFHLSLSAGVVAVSSSFSSLGQHIERAEQQLTKAAHRGSGRVVSPTSSAPDDENATVLVVEDSEEVILLLEHALSRENLEVISFANGREAFRAAPSLSPAAVVLDIKLPGMDGFELLRRLRKMPAYAHRPILLLSALNNEHHVVKGFQWGADDYISKPFSPPELVARIRRLIGEPVHR